MRPVLVADCITKSWDSQAVLASASFRCVPGQIRALMGRNGVGKSTLFHVAVGLVRADGGVVFYRERAWLTPKFHRLAQEGLFFWPDHGLPAPGLSVADQLSMMTRFHGSRRPEEVIEMAGLSPLLSLKGAQLSGGERQRVACALAFARRPLCLIADEPFRGVAPKDADNLAHMLRAMAGDGCAIGISGHDVETVLDTADHVTWCTAGTTHELGSPAEARAHYHFAREYLGPRSFSAGRQADIR